MELDDLKNSWEEVNSQVEKQQNLTPKMIDQMTQKKYYASLKKIAYPEIIGSIICLIAVAFIALNFNKLNTPFLQGVGITSVLLLFALPAISLLSLWQLNAAGDVNKPYSETLKKFAGQKIRFLKFQKLNITLSYLLLVSIIILMAIFFGGKDITGNKYFWILSFPLGYIFLLFYSKWVFKNYNKTIQQAEELLHELAS